MYQRHRRMLGSALAALLALSVAPAAVLATSNLTTSLSGGGQVGQHITVVAGTTVTDQAWAYDSINGPGALSPDGVWQMRYTVWTDAGCNGTQIDAGTKSGTWNAAHDSFTAEPSDPVALVTAGVYWWRAEFGFLYVPPAGGASEWQSWDISCDESVTVTLPPVTRTQGFWGTHPQIAQIAWFGGSAFGHTFAGVAATSGIGDIMLCGRPVDTLGKLTGGFWSGIAKTSTGARRTALDKARMQLLQQLLAAEMNASAFGSVPTGGTAMFAQWESALCGTDAGAIATATQQADSFNNSGDGLAFTPGAPADSRYARSTADVAFWDIVKP